MLVSSLFRKIDQLGIFSLQGDMLTTPLELVEKIKHIFLPQIQDMIENESTEFIEGFLAGALYGGKFVQLGGDMAVDTGNVPVEKTAEVRGVQIDTVLTILAEYLMEQRKRH